MLGVYLPRRIILCTQHTIGERKAIEDCLGGGALLLPVTGLHRAMRRILFEMQLHSEKHADVQASIKRAV
jgi:hypothetical protein